MSGRRRRQQKSTCLIVCEGKADKNFLDFLRQIYQNGNWSFRVEKAGGDPNEVLMHARKNGAGFNKIYCVSDNDKKITHLLSRGYVSLRLTPCLEAYLLKLVYGQSVTQNIKSTFETFFNREAQKIDKDEWSRKIIKSQLEAWRNQNDELNKLIQIFEQC